MVSNVSKGPRFPNSHQVYFSYQIRRRVFCELAFLKIIISPTNVEDLNAEKLEEGWWRFLLILCASLCQLGSKCSVGMQGLECPVVCSEIHYFGTFIYLKFSLTGVTKSRLLSVTFI